MVVLLRPVLEILVLVLFEAVVTIEAVGTEEPPLPPPLNAHDADISRRSPGRKLGHAFGFNCNILSFYCKREKGY